MREDATLRLPAPDGWMDGFDSSTRARETTADAESGVDGGIFFFFVRARRVAPIVRSTRSIGGRLESRCVAMGMLMLMMMMTMMMIR